MIAFQSLADLSSAVESGALSPREIVDAYLERIERFDQKLHAYVSVYAQEARAAADAAGEAIGEAERERVEADNRRKANMPDVGDIVSQLIKVVPSPIVGVLGLAHPQPPARPFRPSVTRRHPATA